MFTATALRFSAKLLISVLLLFSTAARSAAAPTKYYVTDLSGQPLPGVATSSRMSARDFNNYGQVVGDAPVEPGGYLRGFLWQPSSPNATTGTFLNLGDLPGVTTQAVNATRINNHGAIVGHSYRVLSRTEIFLRTPDAPNSPTGTMTSIVNTGSSPSGYSAQGFNDYGQVAAHRGTNIYLWQPQSPGATTGAFVEIPPPPGLPDQAVSGPRLNAFGQIVGARHETLDTFATTLWTPTSVNASSGTTVVLPNPPGATSAQPYAISDDGHVFGRYTTAAGERFFVWTPSSPNASTGAYSYLGPLSFSDISPTGWLVGYGELTPGGGGRGILRTPEGTFDLSTLIHPSSGGWTIHSAGPINDRGQILAWANDSRTVLLTPIPEPASLLLILAPCAALLRRRRSR